MLFNLYECNGFIEDMNGEPVKCDTAFWANAHDLTVCPSCGNESLEIFEQKEFIERKEE